MGMVLEMQIPVSKSVNPQASGEEYIPVIGYVFSNTDCNDSDPTINSDAEELCDSIDQNRNTIIDDNPIDGQTYYLDVDGDGLGLMIRNHSMYCWNK